MRKSESSATDSPYYHNINQLSRNMAVIYLKNEAAVLLYPVNYLPRQNGAQQSAADTEQPLAVDKQIYCNDYTEEDIHGDRNRAFKNIKHIRSKIRKRLGYSGNEALDHSEQLIRKIILIAGVQTLHQPGYASAQIEILDAQILVAVGYLRYHDRNKQNNNENNSKHRDNYRQKSCALIDR